MNTRVIVSLAAAALALCSATAPASLKNLENAYETDTAHLTLPGGAGDRLTLRECADCPSVALRTGRDTRFYIGAGTAAVNLQALRAAVAGDGARMVTVFYDLQSKVVTRIVLSAG